MTIFKSKSLSDYIQRFLVLFSSVVLVVVFFLMKQGQWQSWNIMIMMSITTLCLFIACSIFKQRVLSSVERAVLHIEAIKMEDYTQFAKSDFPRGSTAELHQQLKNLSHHLQSQKSRYDQHAFLLYQLIDQLNTPMMVFNKKLKLTYANSAFSLLYGQPWQMFRLSSPSVLGLIKTQEGWQLPSKDHQWQISQSEFIDTGESHHLLVFTNIGSAMRASQQNAWQQIIRVMGHEIRNSLTPVSSLAESLMQSNNTPREHQALSVISERCQHLNDFINRFSSLSHNLDLKISAFNPQDLVTRIKALFINQRVIFNIKVTKLQADEVFIEQVLINLIKNAHEAKASEIEITIESEHHASKPKTKITVKDNGHGFANMDNLFVPLFTTKQDGQGIGLTFCRNIIEQHNGTIDLINHHAETPTLKIHTLKSHNLKNHSLKNHSSHEQMLTVKNSNTETGVSVVIMLPAT